jgi:hypothetical protein
LIAAVMTLQQYVVLLPLNVALTIGGFALMGMAGAAIWFLRHRARNNQNSISSWNSFTDEPDYESPDEIFVNAGTAVAIQMAGNAPQGHKDEVRFGRGDFGGGGREGNY